MKSLLAESHGRSTDAPSRSGNINSAPDGALSPSRESVSETPRSCAAAHSTSASVCSARLRLLAAIHAASGSPPGASAPLTEKLRGRQLSLPHVSLRAILKPVTPAQSNFRYSRVCEPPPAVSFRSGTLSPTAAAVLPGRLRAYQAAAPSCSVAGIPPIATICPHARG